MSRAGDIPMLQATANWLVQVDYDLVTAEHMLHAGRYIYVVFMYHLALEKMLKALVTEETQMLPPRTHNLIDLAQQEKLNLSQAQRDFLGKINNASIATRYPADLAQLVAQYSALVVRDYLEQTQEIITWLRQDPRLQTS
jgi:HEPN domain-containing protein